MHIQRIKLSKQTLATVGAGKLALSSSLVYAAGAGKMDSPKQDPVAPPLHLDEISFPFELITPPMGQIDDGAGMGGKTDPLPEDGQGLPPVPDMDGASSLPPQDDMPELKQPRDAAKTLRKKEVGTIWADDLKNMTDKKPRMDFIIDGIRNDVPMQVFLAYSIGKPGANYPWPAMKSGGIKISPNLGSETNILAGVMTQPDVYVIEGDTPFGKQKARKHRSVILSVELSKLENLGGQICFQAVAVPVEAEADGSFKWNAGQASEVDCYRIARDLPEKSGNEGSKDDMPMEEGGKSGSFADEDMYNPQSLEPTGATEEAAGGKAGTTSSEPADPNNGNEGSSSTGLGK